MLKRAEKSVLYTILATALIGLMGMRTSFSEENSIIKIDHLTTTTNSKNATE